MTDIDQDNELTGLDYTKLIKLVDCKIGDYDLQVQCCKVFENRKEGLKYYEEGFQYYTNLKNKLDFLFNKYYGVKTD